jgi:hypothetical protein
LNLLRLYLFLSWLCYYWLLVLLERLDGITDISLSPIDDSAISLYPIIVIPVDSRVVGVNHLRLSAGRGEGLCLSGGVDVPELIDGTGVGLS